MEEKYVTLIQNQINEGGDPQLVRNLEFTVPMADTLAKMYIKNLPYMDKNRDEVRATPIENIVAAKELLEHNKSPAALETAVKLMTKALVQQEKATSSRRLESDPALCWSSTASKAPGAVNHGTRPDNESHTGCRGFINRSAIEVGVWRFVEGGKHGGAIQDGGSTSLPSFRSRNGGETLRAAIIHYKATSARLQ
jgi:hypothetical protein